MKNAIITIGTVCWLLLLAAVALGQEPAQAGSMDLGTLHPSDNGTFVDINVGPNLIKMASRLAGDEDPEMARLLNGLKSIRVNVMEFDAGEAESIRSRIQAIRKQAEARHWERIVTVKEDDADVGIQAKLDSDRSIDGLVVTVIEDNTVVLVYVDGSIRPEELARVGNHLNLHPLKQVGGMLKESGTPKAADPKSEP